MLGVAMHLLKGTSYIYQGEEIGMTNVPFESIDDLKDIESIEFYKTQSAIGREKEAWEAILLKGRDNARTPMQWTNDEYGGFSTNKPWIIVNPNYKTINVEKSKKDPLSILSFYKALIEFKSHNKVAIYGEYEEAYFDHKRIFAYIRRLGTESFIVICNFTKEVVEIDLSPYKNKEIIISNVAEPKENVLEPFEARVINLGTTPLFPLK